MRRRRRTDSEGRRGLIRVDGAEGLQERNGGGDLKVGVEHIQVQEVGVVADEVAGATVHCTQQEGDVVFIDGIVAEVVEFDFHDFGEKGELAQESQDHRVPDPALAEFQRVFGRDVL